MLPALLHLTHMRKPLLAALLLIAGGANAASLTGGYPACLTEDLFDQMMQALVTNDQTGQAYLLKSGCIVPAAGLQASLLKRASLGKIQIRVYSGTRAFVLWTNTENLAR